MKKSKQCPKCDSLRIGVMDGGPLVLPDMIETYLCGECGYLESYAKSPKSFSLSGLRWINPKAEHQGPFR